MGSSSAIQCFPKYYATGKGAFKKIGGTDKWALEKTKIKFSSLMVEIC